MGPLPAAVYWRRRWVALASVLTVAGLLTVAVGGGSPRTVRRPSPLRQRCARPWRGRRPPSTDAPLVAAAPGARRRRRQVGAGVAPTRSTSDCPARPRPGRPRRVVGCAPGSRAPVPRPPSRRPRVRSLRRPAPPAAASSTAASERIRPDDTPRPTVAAQPPVPVPRTGPVPCTNDMLTARRGGRSRRAQGRQPSRPAPGDHQRQRPAVRPRPRRRPPGDRRLERRRRRPALVEQRLRQQPAPSTCARWCPAAPSRSP